MTRRQFRLTDLDLDEISQVVSGDDPTAHILIIKGSPSGESMHVSVPLSDEFKHKDKMRKRKKTTRKSRAKAMEAIDNMAKDDTSRANRIR